MAYVVARPLGAWELRESRSTPAGPRARTLATFRTLTPAVLERAAGRALRPLDRERIRASARRAGAPVAASAADRAAGELLAQLSDGRRPRAVLQRLLLDALQGDREASPPTPRPVREPAGPKEPPARTGPARAELSDSARAAAAWIAAGAQARGEALRDLLLLSDRLPQRRAPGAGRFPRLHSAPA